jgi:mono/diheme cytochrome c family protein
VRRAGLLAAMLFLAGCNDQSMRQQPKFRTFRGSSFWADGTTSRPPPDHTIARGDLARDAAVANRPPITQALLDRGEERFNIYCQPCHGLTGRGDGMIVQRGFPAPPDLDSPRLRAAPADHIFDVITHGYGVMYSYAARVEPADRWAIAAYVRALQTSAGVQASAVPDERSKLP